MEANAAILADMKFSVGAVNLFSPHCSCLCYKTFGFPKGYVITAAVGVELSFVRRLTCSSSVSGGCGSLP